MRQVLVWVAGVLSGVGAPMTAWAQERPYEYWGMHYMWGPWGIGMMLMMLVFWGLVIVALVLGVRWLISQGKEPRSDSALEALRQRYAKGEISNEKFEAMKRDLA
jgi:putative membrane protein